MRVSILTLTHLSIYVSTYLSTSLLYRVQNLSDNITEICHVLVVVLVVTVVFGSNAVSNVQKFASVMSIESLKHVVIGRNTPGSSEI
jgi:purine-cytosine permease-like protein